MQPGFVCVAGINPATGRHVRPVTSGRIGIDLLAPNGGPFDVAVEVELGRARPTPTPPEIEDHLVVPSALRKVRELTADKFWLMIESAARERLSGIFGPDFCRHGGTWIIESHKGKASLGCLSPQAPPFLEVCVEDHHGEKMERIRCHVKDRDGECFPPVTDLRLYCPDEKTPRRDVVDDLNRRLKAGTPALLSVGVTRAMSQDKHWFQVNNLHLRDNPCWRLPTTWVVPARKPNNECAARPKKRPSAVPVPQAVLEGTLRKHWGYEQSRPATTHSIASRCNGRNCS
jgi:hypothetical protein